MVVELISTTERYVIEDDTNKGYATGPSIAALILLDRRGKIKSIELEVISQGLITKFEISSALIKPIMDFFNRDVAKHLVIEELSKEGEQK